MRVVGIIFNFFIIVSEPCACIWRLFCMFLESRPELEVIETACVLP